MNDELLLEDEDLIGHQKFKREPFCYTTLKNLRIKDYIEELEHKLPNEFRGSIRYYNHYNSNHLDYLPDFNHYGYF